MNVIGSTVDARLEVPVLVEDVVGRQQRLVVATDDAPAMTEHRGVEERLAVAGTIGFDGADQDAQLRSRTVAAMRSRSARFDVDEAGVIQQVARRIAGRGQFRQDEQIGAGSARAGGRRRRRARSWRRTRRR